GRPDSPRRDLIPLPPASSGAGGFPCAPRFRSSGADRASLARTAEPRAWRPIHVTYNNKQVTHDP
ncbi:hypothetical protein, partial [Pseudomonas aeruginosa]|uniref:hypothetical protein n=1 Tax=Pseudomonas aeruginosa TaxID=287 RepID=UPI001C3E8B25